MGSLEDGKAPGSALCSQWGSGQGNLGFAGQSLSLNLKHKTGYLELGGGK